MKKTIGAELPTKTISAELPVKLTKSKAKQYNILNIYVYRRSNEMTKALISVTGLDTTGIIASVATRLSEMNINILDITQTILDGYFTMMMIVDLDGANLDFEEINRRLQPVRDEKKMTIHMQRMDIFDAMHRI